MFCSKCGAEVPDGKNFCPACGASLKNEEAAPNNQTGADTTEIPVNSQNTGAGVQNVQPTYQNTGAGTQNIPAGAGNAGGKTGKNGKIIVAAVAVLAVVLIAAVFLKGGSKGSDVREFGSKTGVLVTDDYLFNFNGEYEEIDEEIYNSKNSYDLNMVVYRTEKDDLYYAKKDLKPVQIDENVGRYYISSDGKIVAYQVDESIYLYQISNGESKEVATELYSSSWCISPDGKTVMYQKETSKGYALYVAGWSDEEEKIAGEASAIAVSNNGKYKYYYQSKDGENRLYLAVGSKEGEKIDTLGSTTFYLNKDYTEILYTNAKDSTYIYRTKKTDPIKVVGKGLSELMTNNYFDLGAAGYQLMESSFVEQVIRTGDTIYWINSKYEGVKIASIYSQYQLSADGKSLLYTTSKGKLVKVSKFSNDMKETELYSTNEVKRFVASSDLSTIYFMNEDYDLYYFASEKKQEKLLSDADEIDSIAYNNADGKLYYVLDGELYSVTTKASKKSKEADEISAVMSDGFKGICYINEDGEYYYKESGKWKLILPED